MISELGWIYLFNIILNTVLSFYTSILFVLMFVFLLRIKHPRIKTFCYAMPFCKIIFDLFLYQLPNWALATDLNPLLAPIGTRVFSIGLSPWLEIGLSLENGLSFSLADLIALHLGPMWIQRICILGITGTLIAIILYTFRMIQSLFHIRHIVHNAKPLQRALPHPLLNSLIFEKQIQCRITNAISSPCIFGKTLLFPCSLMSDLSEHEFEAIVVHELAHLQWKDPLIRILCSSIATIFWWLPSNWWHQCMVNLQERASDQAIDRFGISKLDLAEAIVKTAKNSTASYINIALSLVEHPTHFAKRIEELLQHEPKQRSPYGKIIQYGLLVLLMSIILFGKLWIF
jgi:beta-lactamase regulating signal transducer with metallopeptidase domain